MYGKTLSEVKQYSRTLGFFPEYLSDAERRHSSKWHEGKSQNRN